MKPQTAPTSPKYPHEQRLQHVWEGSKLQQPMKVPVGTIVVFAVLSALIAVALAWGGLIWLAIAHPNSYLVKALPTSVTTIIQSVPTNDRALITTPTAVTRAAESVVSVIPEKATSPIIAESVSGQAILLTSNGWAWMLKSAQPSGQDIKIAVGAATFGVTKTLSDAYTSSVFLKTTAGGGRAMDIVDPADVHDGQQVWIITKRLQTSTITPKRLRITGVSSWSACEQYHPVWSIDGGWIDPLGGAVVDEKGRMVGFLGTNGTIIPADVVQPVLDHVLQQNDTSRPGCGFRLLTSDDVILSKQPTTNFWLVGAHGDDLAVTSKSAADLAGLKSGDRITKIDGADLPADPGQFFRSLKIGQTIKLDVVRGTAKITLNLKTSSIAP